MRLLRAACVLAALSWNAAAQAYPQADARDLGYELGGNSAEEFSAYIHSEVNKWGGVIRDAKIKAQ